MSINSVSSSSSQASIIAEMSERLLKKSDTNQDNTIDKSELVASLQNAPAAPDGSAAPDAESLFAKIDADGDGQITQSELESDMESHASQEPPSGAPSGTPPSGAGGGGASGSSSSSSSNKVYEDADTNKDGTVSYQEQVAYDLKHSDDAKKAAIDQKRNEPAPYARLGNVIDTQA
jgi:Ca2+-binding EF-hand superfamily protein